MQERLAVAQLASPLAYFFVSPEYPVPAFLPPFVAQCAMLCPRRPPLARRRTTRIVLYPLYCQMFYTN
jgi:hypothetical protein